MAADLKDMFDMVVSGKDYDKDQIKNASNLTNTIVKVLRFEFEVYKHFVKDNHGMPGRPSKDISIDVVADWLRKRGDDVKVGDGAGLWKINGRACEDKDLLIRANHIRNQRGERPFVLSGGKAGA